MATNATIKGLLYTPLYPLEPRIRPQTWRSIQALEWDAPLDVIMGREDYPQETHVYENICKKFSYARNLALDNGYDFLLTVEFDMIVPPDALRRLMAVDADVVYGLYTTRREQFRLRWLAFSFTSLRASIWWQNHPMKKLRKLWGHPVYSAGVGFGCTLIRRRVLEKVPFRCHPQHEVANDWMFAVDVQEAGFQQKHHFGVVCGHIMDDGKRAVYPTLANPSLVEIRDI